MNLPFMEYLVDKKTKERVKTNFSPKIIAGLVSMLENRKMSAAAAILNVSVLEACIAKLKKRGYDTSESYIPKIHTIREIDFSNGKANWTHKIGKPLDFFHWLDRPYHSGHFKFAPRLPLIATERLQVKGEKLGYKTVYIEGKRFYDSRTGLGKEQMLKLSQNDGFETIEDFFKWFPIGFDGAILHWTNYRYIKKTVTFETEYPTENYIYDDRLTGEVEQWLKLSIDATEKEMNDFYPAYQFNEINPKHKLEVFKAVNGQDKSCIVLKATVEVLHQKAPFFFMALQDRFSKVLNEIDNHFTFPLSDRNVNCLFEPAPKRKRK